MDVKVANTALSSMLLMFLLFSTHIKCTTGGINRPLDSALNRNQRTVSDPNDLATDIVTVIITELDWTTIRETTSVTISTTETRTTLLDNTPVSSSQSATTTLTDSITNTDDITSEATTTPGTTNLDNTVLSSTQSTSPPATTNRNPDVSTSSDQFPTDDSAITVSPHQSSSPSSEIPTRVLPTEHHSTLVKTESTTTKTFRTETLPTESKKTESLTTEFHRTDTLQTKPKRTRSTTENGNPGTDTTPVTEEPSIWHNPTFVALFSLALSTIILILIMLIICCIICQQMKDTSKREEAFNERFTALQMHALRRVGPTPVGYGRGLQPLQALPKSEVEQGFVSEHNWDEMEIRRPGVPVIAWL